MTDIANVVVTVPEGTWPLSGSLVFRLQRQGLYQIIVDVDRQQAIALQDEEKVHVTGDYEDLIGRRLSRIELPYVALPDEVISIAEFQDASGLLVGAEVELRHGSFSVLAYPEDIEIRPSGSIWNFIREYGLDQLKSIVVIKVENTSTSKK